MSVCGRESQALLGSPVCMSCQLSPSLLLPSFPSPKKKKKKREGEKGESACMYGGTSYVESFSQHIILYGAVPGRSLPS